MNRRTFLTVLGSGGAGVTIGSLGLARLLPPGKNPNRKAPLHERTALSTCGGCSAGCSVVLRIVDDRLVGIRGNPKCPLAGGGLCARGASEVEAFYDPDRLVGPVRQTGERGGDAWGRLTWDEALDALARRLAEIRKGGRQGRVGVVLGPGRGVVEATAEAFVRTLGSSHVYRSSGVRDEASTAAAALTLGWSEECAYDLAQTDYLLSFGAPVLEGWLSPAWVAATFGQARARKEHRLRFVQVESRLSPTAMRADQWIAVNPGTETMFALGIASAIVRERLVDRDFLERTPHGFEAWTDSSGARRQGFSDLLNNTYTPTAVSAATGVPIVTLIAVAREFARAHAPLALGERLAGSAGAFGLAAVQSLNALRGRIGAAGGVVRQMGVPVSPLSAPASAPAPASPFAPAHGASVWSALADEPPTREPPFDLLFLSDGAALSGLAPDDPAWKALSRVPHIVSFATGLDLSTRIADVVLPATTRFEQWNDVVPPPATGLATLALSRPALPRLADGRDTVQVFLDLAKRLGPSLTLALPFANTEAVIRHRLRGLAAVRRGMPYSTSFQREWASQMAAGGWWLSPASSPEKLFALILESGGWLDPVVAPTERDRIEYRFAPKLHLTNARAEGFPYPEPWTTSKVSPALAPDRLWLIPFAAGGLVGCGTPNRPTLLQLAGAHVEGAFRPWAEFNPADAKRLGLREGGLAEIASDAGRIIVSVRHYPGIPEGAVAVAMGPAGVGGGRWSRSWSDGASRLLGAQRGAVIGCRLAAGIAVQVTPATRGPA
ncbi:MAG: molybdopterin-dependent oxidoreductase [Deltaproteobacteria bacterium]|nr:molybdopterin-dependent oxidoreductase [Deltaproteobacteria bacterium]